MTTQENILSGVVSAHPQGFGFVVSPDAENFVPPPAMKSVVPGDVISYVVETNAKTNKSAARVVALLNRPSTHWLGEVVPMRNGAKGFAPDDAIFVQLRVAGLDSAKIGDVVAVRIQPATALTDTVDATVYANLGPRNKREFDVTYATVKAALPDVFSEAALAEANALAAPTLEAGRSDLRNLPFVTIDGETTRDYDDAVFMEQQGEGSRLYVAIADVSHYVKPGSALDAVAQDRATSVYFSQKVIPMLPEKLSNGLCSLVPGEDRLALVCAMDFDAEGRFKGYQFSRALIRSHARLTYTQVAAWLDNGTQSEDPQVAQVIAQLYAWYQKQLPARAKRGLMEFRDAEPKLKIQDNGDYAMEWEENTVADQLVEECMLAANRAAAKQLTVRGEGKLFRHHQGVDVEKWAETREWLQAHGVVTPEQPTLEALRDLLVAHKDHELGAVIEFKVRRSLAPANYDESNSHHYTLGFEAYTHFTSPIRRYPDLIVHRLLTEAGSVVSSELVSDLSLKARRAQIASRYPWDRLKRRLLWDAKKPVMAAQIVTMSRRGIKVVVEDWDATAFLPDTTLTPLGLTWNVNSDCWMRGTEVMVGQSVTVNLTKLLDKGPVCELEATLVV